MNTAKIRRPCNTPRSPGDFLYHDSQKGHPWFRRWQRKWNNANSGFWGSPSVVEKRMSFSGCPAMIKDCDGREWRTHINVALALSDLIGSGLTERVMDGFAGLDGRIDINNLRELCRQIGKSSMASDQSLTIEFLCPVLPAGYERGLASEPLVSYNVCNRRRSIRQSFRTRLPTRCQYAKGDRCTHAQHIDIEIALQSSKPTSVAVLHKIVERFANCSMYGLLKLDEALELPVECDGTEKYVQTIAEEIYIQLRARASVQGAYVQCESAESVHNYRGVGQVSDLEWSSDNLYLNDSKDY